MSFVEFPKCLYRHADLSGDTVTVASVEEQMKAQAEGWLTVDEIYAGQVPLLPEKKKSKK